MRTLPIIGPLGMADQEDEGPVLGSQVLSDGSLGFWIDFPGRTGGEKEGREAND
jgi:hypothetical protein